MLNQFTDRKVKSAGKMHAKVVVVVVGSSPARTSVGKSNPSASCSLIETLFHLRFIGCASGRHDVFIRA